MPKSHTIIVPAPSAAAVARHYGISERGFRKWIRETPNARILGSLDSPAMRSLVKSYRSGANYAGMARGLDWERIGPPRS